MSALLIEQCEPGSPSRQQSAGPSKDAYPVSPCSVASHDELRGGLRIPSYVWVINLPEIARKPLWQVHAEGRTEARPYDGINPKPCRNAVAGLRLTGHAPECTLVHAAHLSGTVG
jgi:hypothetical protein